jgi:hypothetical protein
MVDVILKMILNSSLWRVFGKTFDPHFSSRVSLPSSDNDERSGSVAHSPATESSRGALLMNWKKPHKGDAILMR